MHRQADDGGGKAAFTDGSGDGEAVHAGHVDVEDGDLRMEPFDGRERRLTVPASPTTENPGSRSRSWRKPCRKTGWSSAMKMVCRRWCHHASFRVSVTGKRILRLSCLRRGARSRCASLRAFWPVRLRRPCRVLRSGGRRRCAARRILSRCPQLSAGCRGPPPLHGSSPSSHRRA